MIKWRNKDIEKLDDVRSYLMNNRPKYRKGVVEKVWQTALNKKPRGKVFDPYIKPRKELTWDRSKSRYRQWHMGHIYEHEYKVLVDEYIKDRNYDKFLKDYNNPDNYQPQDPVSNMNHEHEKKTNKKL